MALGSTQPLTEMSTRGISGGKGGRCVRLTTLPPFCAVVMKSGKLNFLEHCGPVQACNGTTLILALFFSGSKAVEGLNLTIHHHQDLEWVELFVFPTHVPSWHGQLHIWNLKVSVLVLFWDTIAVLCEMQMKQENILCGQSLDFILVINQLDAQNLFYSKFISCLYMFRTPCAHRQEVKIVLYSLWYHHTCRWPSGGRVEWGLCTGWPPTGVMIPDAV